MTTDARKRRQRLYLAGPMRGLPEFNFPAFHEAAHRLIDDGWEVFNPAHHDEINGFDPSGLTGNENLAYYGFDLRAALAVDLAYITEQADAVAVLPGWEKSRGARAEVSTALALGLRVFTVPDADGKSHDITRIPPEPIPTDVGARLMESFNAAMRKYREAQNPKVCGPCVVDESGGLAERIIPLEEGIAAARAGGEVRVTSETGGEKGVKPEQYQSIPAAALRELAEHYAKGAAKYEDHNYRRGYPWSSSFSALNRHLWAFWGGEDIDPETGSKHVTAVAWHALTLATFMDEHPDYDDRYKGVAS